MDSVILVFVTVVFASSLAINFTVAVLCAKKFNFIFRKIKKIEKTLGEVVK